MRRERGSRSLLDFIQTPVMVGDPDGRVVYVNPAFETDFLVPLEEVAGAAGGEPVRRAAAARRCCTRWRACAAARASATRSASACSWRTAATRRSPRPVEAEGGRVGVILLLVRESAGEARMQSFRREILAPLDELSACLSAVAEHATGPDAQAQRIAIADGVRCLERVRKWADGVAASLKTGGRS